VATSSVVDFGNDDHHLDENGDGSRDDGPVIDTDLADDARPHPDPQCDDDDGQGHEGSADGEDLRASVLIGRDRDRFARHCVVLGMSTSSDQRRVQSGETRGSSQIHVWQHRWDPVFLNKTGRQGAGSEAAQRP